MINGAINNDLVKAIFALVECLSRFTSIAL
jgi:hypothetical protein